MARQNILLESFVAGFAGGALAHWILSTVGRERNVQVQNQAQQVVVNDLGRLRTVIAAVVTGYECEHLRKFVREEPFPFLRDATTQFFLPELRRLEALGFIEAQPGRSIETLVAQGGDVRDHLRVTSNGREYLALRDDVASRELMNR
jgi:hypothetical protein